jgi:hypothetical protein
LGEESVIMKTSIRTLIVAAACGAAWIASTKVQVRAAGTNWYASPNGTGTGTVSNPMSLSQALSSTGPAQPGDTIWLRGGTYLGAFNSQLTGTATAPIVVRGYPGERATLDANSAAARSAGSLLAINGAHVVFRDFEVTSSDAGRTDQNVGYGNFPSGIDINQSQDIKLVNLVIHDLVGKGIGAWSENTSAEIVGCLIYYNGLSDHDHGIYVQNQNGTKRIADNIIFDQASHGIHGYGSTDAYLNNITIEGNTAFNNGYLIQQSSRNILIGGGSLAQNPIVKANYTYFSDAKGNSNIGYSAGATNAIVQDNYWIAGNAAVRLINLDANSTVTGNFFSGPLDPADTATRWPSNTFTSRKPTTGETAFVRPNPYEAGRANITVYNWSQASSVAVNLSGAGLAGGDTFEIRDAMNFYGSPVVTGVYTGDTVNIPMTGLTAAVPVGQSLIAPRHPAPAFGAFVLLKTGSQPAGDDSGGSDTTAAAVSLTSPTSGQTVSGAITVAASATDSVAAVQFQVDGVDVDAAVTTAPYTLSWDTTRVADGLHVISAVARDTVGDQTTSPGVTVSVNNSVGVTSGETAQVIVEAESAVLIWPFTTSNSPASSGNYYISTPTSDAGAAILTFTVPYTGTYVVWARVVGNDDTHDSFVVRIDGGDSDIFDVAENKWSPDWQWSVICGRGSGGPASISPRTFELSAGTHTLTFEGREQDTLLDEILVTNNLEFRPSSANPIDP